MERLQDLRTLSQLDSYLDHLESLEGIEHSTYRSELEDALSSLSIVHQIRTIIMTSIGLDHFPRYLERFDRLFTACNLSLPQPLTPVIIGNLGFLSPTTLRRGFPYYSQELRYLDYNASAALLCREQCYELIRDYLKSDSKVLLSPTFTILFAFAIARYQAEEERELLRLLSEKLDKRAPSANLVRTCIMRRLEMLAAPPQQKKLRCKTALLISGQLRGIEFSIPLWREMYDLPNLDVYVSTWQQVGRTSIDSVRLTRRLTHDLATQVRQRYSKEDLEKIAEVDRRSCETQPSEVKSLVERSLQGANSIHTHFANAEAVEFRAMSNSDKMHYHNGYWVKALGSDFFQEKYDYIIKTRPDLLLSQPAPIGPETVREGGKILYDDHPSWLFEPWGFGVGDQLFGGEADLMLPLLAIDYPRSLSTRLMAETFGKAALTMGHVNIGIELWLAGGRPRPIGVTKRGLAVDKKLSIEEWNQLAEAAEIDQL